MNIITIDHKTHVYTNNVTSKIYSSTSSVVAFFRKEFDEVYWSKRKAYQEIVPGFPSIAARYKDEDYALFDELEPLVHNKELFNLYVKNFKKEWDLKRNKSIVKGHGTHSLFEDEDIKRGYAINPFNGKPYKVYTNETADFFNLKPGCYIEYIMHDESNMIAGTPDKVFLCWEDHKLYVDQYDYKTNENLFKTSYKDRKFIKPFNHVFDNKINGYTFAMSSYHYMLSLVGCTPRSSYLVTAKDIKQMGTVQVPIWIEDAKKMHQVYRESNPII